MIRSSDIFRNIRASLTFRVLLLLTMTMAPIGALAVYQTSRLSITLEQQAASALVASTVSATTPKLVALERAIGAATAVSLATDMAQALTPACAAVFDRAISAEGGYRFSGVVTPQGISCLSSTDASEVRSVIEGHYDFQLPAPFLVRSGENGIMIFGQPVDIDGAVTHFVLIESVGKVTLEAPTAGLSAPLAVAILTRDGEVLADGASGTLEAEIPQIAPVLAAYREQGNVLSIDNESGEERVYSVVPLFGDFLYGISVWSPETAFSAGVGSRLAPWVFPIVMWLATLCISYVAINRLVVRHVRHLGRRMRRFARNRTLPITSLEGKQPFEFSEMEEDFRHMAEAILQDEAELENTLHEKTLLLREVHHRVKNNLQLIASIMNMQIRKCRDDETNDIIRRLQDRVLGLAAIHRQMYEADTLNRVPADKLVDAILEQTVSLQKPDEIEFAADLESVTLLPDQAVPLALLTAEVATNALAYASVRSGDTARIEVHLTNQEDGSVALEIGNSTQIEEQDGQLDKDQWRSGLGSQLIDAFTRQISGQMSSGVSDGMYRTRVVFRPTGLVDGQAKVSTGAGDQTGAERSVQPMAAQ